MMTKRSVFSRSGQHSSGLTGALFVRETELAWGAQAASPALSAQIRRSPGYRDPAPFLTRLSCAMRFDRPHVAYRLLLSLRKENIYALFYADRPALLCGAFGGVTLLCQRCCSTGSVCPMFFVSRVFSHGCSASPSESEAAHHGRCSPYAGEVNTRRPSPPLQFALVGGPKKRLRLRRIPLIEGSARRAWRKSQNPTIRKEKGTHAKGKRTPHSGVRVERRPSALPRTALLSEETFLGFFLSIS